MSRLNFNELVALRLREVADLLERQGADGFRVNAFRRAGASVLELERPLEAILDEAGEEGLRRIPGIGAGIAAAIREMADTGSWARLERLRGQSTPEKLFQVVPGIGARLAAAIHDQLGVDTLEGLEVAAHDGRLGKVPGVGPRRAAAIRASLGEILQRPRRHRHPDQGPGVEIVLDIDREYREQAGSGTLACIAPRRFNPAGEAWLPVMHATRGAWHFTVLFSNTARAHELGRTKDWVVIYFYDDHHHEDQHTVVTETRGPLAGRRVVRGREEDCRAFYARRDDGPLDKG